ncbi:type II secretion system protein GspM [Pseudomonas sp. TE3610]
MRSYWHQRSVRERRGLQGLGIFLAVVIGYVGAWLPAREYLAQVRIEHQQQLQLQHALAAIDHPGKMPLADRLRESAERGNVTLRELTVERGSLHLLASGEALALLRWLASLEHMGNRWQSLETLRQEDELVVRLRMVDG